MTVVRHEASHGVARSLSRLGNDTNPTLLALAFALPLLLSAPSSPGRVPIAFACALGLHCERCSLSMHTKFSKCSRKLFVHTCVLCKVDCCACNASAIACAIRIWWTSLNFNMSFRFRFSDFQIFDFRFLFFQNIFPEKYVGEISRNK